MLFRKNIEPSCGYCKYGASLGFGEVACSKRGIMEDIGSCTSFCYEPTKRKPEFARTPAKVSFSEEDMMI